jgi:hypothetical protein
MSLTDEDKRWMCELLGNVQSSILDALHKSGAQSLVKLRNEKLSPERRSEIASTAALAKHAAERERRAVRLRPRRRNEDTL